MSETDTEAEVITEPEVSEEDLATEEHARRQGWRPKEEFRKASKSKNEPMGIWQRYFILRT